MQYPSFFDQVPRLRMHDPLAEFLGASEGGILDYGFSPFPSTFDSRTTRKTLTGQATVQLASNLQVSGGARYEREQGYDDVVWLDAPTHTQLGEAGTMK